MKIIYSILLSRQENKWWLGIIPAYNKYKLTKSFSLFIINIITILSGLLDIGLVLYITNLAKNQKSMSITLYNVFTINEDIFVISFLVFLYLYIVNSLKLIKKYNLNKKYYLLGICPFVIYIVLIKKKLVLVDDTIKHVNYRKEMI